MDIVKKKSNWFLPHPYLQPLRNKKQNKTKQQWNRTQSGCYSWPRSGSSVEQGKYVAVWVPRLRTSIMAAGATAPPSPATAPLGHHSCFLPESLLQLQLLWPHAQPPGQSSPTRKKNAQRRLLPRNQSSMIFYLISPCTCLWPHGWLGSRNAARAPRQSLNTQYPLCAKCCFRCRGCHRDQTGEITQWSPPSQSSRSYLSWWCDGRKTICPPFRAAQVLPSTQVTARGRANSGRL